MPSFEPILSEKREMVEAETLTPFMQEMPRAKGRTWPRNCSQTLGINWSGRLKTRIVESLTDS